MSIFSRSSRTRTTLAASNSTPVPHDLEAEILRHGHAFLDRARRHKTGLLSAAFWSDKLMDWAMQDEVFKVQLFRFVDAFPRLKSAEDVHDHLVDYLTQPGVTLPPGLGVGLKAGGLFKGAQSKMMTGRITAMAEKFIAGTDAASAVPELQKLWKRGVAFSVDLLGEACVSAQEAKSYQAKYLDLVQTLPGAVSGWAPNERLERDHLGAIPRTNVSIKISSLHSETSPIDTEGSIRALMTALEPILLAAIEHDVLINFDIEQASLKDLTLELFMRCCEEWDFTAGLAMQAYLRSGEDDARRVIEWSRSTGRQFTVRLVKGAYWDYETIHAEEMGWPVPVWSRKIDSDACFERMTRRFIEATPRRSDEGGVKLALGSHNARSIAAALAMLEQNDLPPEALEIQMLYGMGDQLKAATTDLGLRLREYIPVGEMIPGMAYLVRRLLENTSNESWLRAGFHDEKEADALLASPHVNHDAPDPGQEMLRTAPERHALSVADPDVGDGRPFTSEPPRDFSQEIVRSTFAEAIQRTTVPVIANDATEADADAALDRADQFRATWRTTPVRDRAAVLVRAAAIMRERRDELSALVIKESGKGWAGADAEVCEAIDFCEFYAREAVPMFDRQRLGRFIGELDEVFHQPRGICTMISPWNFPLAILAGMTVAALVTGNPTIIKPATQTRGIGRTFYDILREAGCPEGAIQFIAGPGRTVGARLVSDPRTSIIAFTGSLDVGLGILEEAGRTPKEQLHVKRVVCEMGGKNAVIIDASADLDEAVVGVREAAFAYQGQRCSACSRVIVVESNYDEFVERLVESTRALTIGDPIHSGVDVGPVIDESARKSIEGYIEIGRGEATLAVGLELPPESDRMPGRAYVAPHIFTDVAPDATIATEEIFGPVLCVIRAKDFAEALEIANRSAYKLTGAVYSRKPANLELAREEFRVGNLYLNRPCTGALVGRQPFGGFGLSGVGSKAGGREYLLQFTEPRCICENTMRRGFAPEL